MKKIVVFILCLFGLISVASCSMLDDVSVGEITENQANSRYSKYQKFSGKRDFDISVESETIVYVVIETTSGEFNLKIGDNSLNGYSGSNLETCSFSVKLSEPGLYKVLITAKNHKGSYKISWE